MKAKSSLVRKTNTSNIDIFQLLTRSRKETMKNERVETC